MLHQTPAAVQRVSATTRRCSLSPLDETCRPAPLLQAYRLRGKFRFEETIGL